MRNLTGQCHLEEAFRQELFRLINQYLSAPEDATLGKIVRKLVNFQQVSAAVENLCQNACMAFLPRTSSRQSSMDISPTISPCSDSGATYPAIGPNSASAWASPQPGLIEPIAVPLNSERRNPPASQGSETSGDDHQPQTIQLEEWSGKKRTRENDL